MRLVDADRLYDQVEARYRLSRGEEHKAERVLLDVICDSPTIDAIPVEWIEWQIMNAKYNGIKEAADAFEFVLNCYKEQETQK